MSWAEEGRWLLLGLDLLPSTTIVLCGRLPAIDRGRQLADLNEIQAGNSGSRPDVHVDFVVAVVGRLIVELRASDAMTRVNQGQRKAHRTPDEHALDSACRACIHCSGHRPWIRAAAERRSGRDRLGKIDGVRASRTAAALDVASNLTRRKRHAARCGSGRAISLEG